jgi:hypothetical protein
VIVITGVCYMKQTSAFSLRYKDSVDSELKSIFHRRISAVPAPGGKQSIRNRVRHMTCRRISQQHRDVDISFCIGLRNVGGNMRKLSICLALVALCTVRAKADTLSAADAFAVLAGSTITNAAYPTMITGDLGVSPGTAVTGFPPGIVTGTIYTGTSAVVELAQINVTGAFNTEAGLPSTGTIAGGALDGLTLGTGVYTVPAATSNLDVDDTLTLTDHGVAGSVFVFLMPSTLITSPGSTINVSGLSPSDSLFWVVGSSATLGVNSAFEGNILASSSISFDPGATDLCGRALAENGAVTFAGQDPSSLIQNQVSMGCVGTSGAGGGGFNGSGPAATPEPATLVLLGLGLSGIGFLISKRRWVGNPEITQAGS